MTLSTLNFNVWSPSSSSLTRTWRKSIGPMAIACTVQNPKSRTIVGVAVAGIVDDGAWFRTVCL